MAVASTRFDPKFTIDRSVESTILVDYGSIYMQIPYINLHLLKCIIRGLISLQEACVPVDALSLRTKNTIVWGVQLYRAPVELVARINLDRCNCCYVRDQL